LNSLKLFFHKQPLKAVGAYDYAPFFITTAMMLNIKLLFISKGAKSNGAKLRKSYNISILGKGGVKPRQALPV
jgi:hypothetical protein